MTADGATPGLTAEVVAAVADWPDTAQARMRTLRALILAVARDCGAGPLTETLKWGEPAWLTERTKSGTTLRMGWKPGRPDHLALLVNCRTDLVDRYRARFPTEFTYEGDRAVLVPVAGPVADEPLRRVIAMALCYHRDRARRRQKETGA